MTALHPLVDLEALPGALKTPEICAAAVRQSGEALQFVPERLKTAELCRQAVETAPMMVDLVPEALLSESMCIEAVRQDPRAFEWVPERLKTGAVADAALAAALAAVQGSVVLHEIPDALRTEALCLEAVRAAPQHIYFVPDAAKTEALCLEAVRREPRLLVAVPELPWRKADLPAFGEALDAFRASIREELHG